MNAYIKIVMRKITYIIPLFLLLMISSYAEEKDSTAAGEEYSIERILESVKDCSDDIAVYDLEYAAGLEEVKFFQAEAMPQISFNTNVSYISQSMKSQALMGNEIVKLFDRLNGALLNWNITLYQPLITFGRVSNALKMAKVRGELLKDTRDFKKDYYYLSVLEAFSKVYLAQSNVTIAQKSLSIAEKLLKRIKLDLLSGGGIRRDSLRIQAMVYSAQSELEIALSNHKIALQRLGKLTELNVPPGTVIIYDNYGWASDVPKESETAKSLSCKLKENETRILLYNSEYERSSILPSLSLVGGISNEYMIPDTSGLTEDYLNYLEQTGQEVPEYVEFDIPKFSDYFNNDFVNYTIGLQLTWNIFDGRRSIAKYRQARINFEKADRELKIINEENEEAIEEARSLLHTLKKTRKAVLLQIESTTAAFNQIQDDYKNGFVDYTTLIETERQLREAEKGLSQMNIQRLLAVSQYKIALGIPLVN